MKRTLILILILVFCISNSLFSSDKEKILLDNMEIVNPFNYMETYKNEK